MPFELVSPFAPRGDQPRAIEELTEGLKRGDLHQTLLGATGTGKTFTIANVIAQHGRPALVMSHNKTLAAQLYGELKQLFPKNAVEYFISYYDYYQPEAYVPSTDTFIEKDSSINEDIERLRLRATSSLMEREDVIIVSSVSCIYGLGDPREYRQLMVVLEVGQEISRKKILESLVNVQYSRNDAAFERGHFRVRGDTVEVYPAYDEQGIRIELWGDEIERISRFDPLTGDTIASLKKTAIYPATHFVTQKSTIERAVHRIRSELDGRLKELLGAGKLLEAQRLESRTNFDIEMMMEIGTCAGIENYSRHIAGRGEGERPACLFDYFPEDFLVVVDESHVSIPQIGGMYNGDRARKLTLVDHGFRLPSALDNRPLIFDEWETLVPKAIFVSATPGAYELEKSGGVVVEQIIRPTGLLDPEVIIRPVKGQVDDLLAEIRDREAKNERVLVTTLTKRMAEDLADFFQQHGVRVRYLHSDIQSLERVEILRELRLGKFDVLIGINLLREGLDLPEVSLVAILDADKEGFLRSASSLIQTVGRAARNSQGTAILYADTVTRSMKKMIEETARRREIQIAYNLEHGIIPQTIMKSVEEIELSTRVADARTPKYETPDAAKARKVAEKKAPFGSKTPEEMLKQLENDMRDAAALLDFERAALLRDQYLDANPALARIYGFDSPAELIAQLKDIRNQLYVEPSRREEFMALAKSRGSVSGFESQVYRKSGEIIWISENARAVFNESGHVVCFEGTVEDVTERKLYQARIEQQANFDTLTGLANRSLLHDRLQQAIRSAAAFGTRLAVVFVDLDRFKFINDGLGHHVGDELLCAMAERLRSSVRDGDTVARLGGDEFVLLINGQREPDAVAALLERMLQAISQPWASPQGEFNVTCSMGVALFPDDGTSAETLLKHADQAMYRAKEKGRNNFQFFTAELNALITERVELENNLRRALERQQFSLHYQPRVDMRTRRITGAEALIRWHVSEDEATPPSRFIPIAEEIGLIVPIGKWVLRAACAQNKAWQDEGLAPFVVSVNVSVRQFRQDNLVQTIADVLRETGLEARYLEVELTESAVMHDADQFIAMLGQLNDLGVQIALDDFGTGYSSLSYLKRLPVDRLKVDRSFVQDIGHDHDDATIVRTIIALGHNLGLKVVAEGVETEQQIDFLRANHCDELQGYYFGRPLPGEQFRRAFLG